MERGGGGEREEIKELPFPPPKVKQFIHIKIRDLVYEATIHSLKEASTHAIQALKDGPSDESVVSKFIL